MKIFSARFMRPALLLAVLLAMLIISTHQRISSRQWIEPLPVTVYPINGDRQLATHNYILELKQADLEPVNDWFSEQAKRYSLSSVRPIELQLGPVIDSIPPQFSAQSGAIGNLWWGLKVRTWVALNTPDDQSNLRRVRMYVIYHRGEDGVTLPHSVGLEKGLIGIVNAFATPEQDAQNNIVIAHELLHTVGATDKYDAFGNPMFPHGYANPYRNPMYPQRYAEIMAVRIPLSAYSSYMALSLRSTQINQQTAREIAWLQ